MLLRLEKVIAFVINFSPPPRGNQQVVKVTRVYSAWTGPKMKR